MTHTLTPEKRKPLTKLEFGLLSAQQAGICGCGCDKPLDYRPKQIRDEHLHQLSMGGTNLLKNRSLWRIQCVAPKNKKDSDIRKKDRHTRKATKKSQKKKPKIAKRELQSKNSPVYSNTRDDTYD